MNKFCIFCDVIKSVCDTTKPFIFLISQIQFNYNPVILVIPQAYLFAKGYIVFAVPFVRPFVRSFDMGTLDSLL